MNLLPPARFFGLPNLRPAGAIRRSKLSTRNCCAARTADTLPSSDTRTALNSRAGIPCSRM